MGLIAVNRYEFPAGPSINKNYRPGQTNAAENVIYFCSLRLYWSGLAAVNFFDFIKIVCMQIKILRLLCLALFIAGLSSCFRNYYKAETQTPANAVQTGAKLDSLSAAGRYVILRNGPGETYHINGLQLNEDKQSATAVLAGVGADHQYYLKKGATKKGRYRKWDAVQRGVLNEAHVYVPYDAAAKEGNYTLRLADVQKIDVVKRDKKRTMINAVLSGIGFAAIPAAAIAVAQAAATLK